MTGRSDLSRRRLLALLAGCAALGRPAAAGPRDQGIGGTGARPAPRGDDEGDRGIGGTGVVGTIRGFGSIIVNGMRISYAPDAEVRVDGADATPAALRVGQVVRTVASGAGGRFSTRRIEVTSEVVGPVETADRRTLVALGQTVSLAGLPKGARRAFRVGETVAVSGLRRPDGVIAASLIEASPAGLEQIAGPLGVAADGALAIGAMKVSHVDPTLVGRRVLLRGRRAGDVFETVQAQDESAPFGPAVRAVSVEAYVERGRDGLFVGSGLPISGVDPSLPLGQPVRAVLTATRGAQGWRIESARVEGAGGPQGAGGAPDGASGGGRREDGARPGGRSDLPTPSRAPGEGVRPGGGASPGPGAAGGPGGPARGFGGGAASPPTVPGSGPEGGFGRGNFGGPGGGPGGFGGGGGR